MVRNTLSVTEELSEVPLDIISEPAPDLCLQPLPQRVSFISVYLGLRVVAVVTRVVSVVINQVNYPLTTVVCG